jgi:hypothetical protein
MLKHEPAQLHEGLFIVRQENGFMAMRTIQKKGSRVQGFEKKDRSSLPNPGPLEPFPSYLSGISRNGSPRLWAMFFMSSSRVILAPSAFLTFVVLSATTCTWIPSVASHR